MLLFDTYALIEIIKGNPNYKKYTESDFIINKFILAELVYWLVKNYGTETAGNYFDKYEKMIKKIEKEVMIKAMKFRYENKNRKLSMVDCISYFQAKELGIKFLTGDKEFENFENVEFVK